jgi:Putative prokaryotic signal transducing protein
MADGLKIVTTVSNEMEAALVCGRLSDAGIRAMAQLSNSGAGGRFGGGGARDVYVEEQNFDRALELLNAEDVSDEEPPA